MSLHRVLGGLSRRGFCPLVVPSYHKLCSFLLFFSCCHKVAFRAFLWLLEKSGENSFARNDSSRTVSEVRVDRTWPSVFKKALFKKVFLLLLTPFAWQKDMPENISKSKVTINDDRPGEMDTLFLVSPKKRRSFLAC